MIIDMQWLKRLLTHRLIFVMGKGGVGKTTISVLLAITASQLNKKVLLVELGDSDAIGQLFIHTTLPETPLPLSDRIWGARVDPKIELEAYTHAHVNPGFIANRITRSRLFDYLFAATPGLKEVMSLGRIWRWEKEKDKKSEPSYDLIIVDSPATGHGLSLLRLPIQLIHMILVGPIVSQIQDLQGALQNHEKTCLALVTLPEELPINEAREFYTEAASSLNIPVEVVFINGVWPAMYTDQEIPEIEKIRKADQGHDATKTLKIMADAAEHHIRRCALQREYIDQIKSHVRCPAVEVPFYFTNDLALKDISDISFSILHSSAGSSE